VRVAVTGASGRLGRALVATLEESPFTGPLGPTAWGRPEFDLDSPDGAILLLQRDRPEVVVHAAAWTDVDGCAREPETAHKRNAVAPGLLATYCAAAGVDLILVSTNEVFDGRRVDDRGYAPSDPPNPINAYGRSKLDGERLAGDAFRDAGPGGPHLGIVRTAWLFGPPGRDFPSKILTAAEAAASRGQPLKVVADETGSPTYASDLAEGIVELLGADGVHGIHHLVNAGHASRSGWARELLRQAGVQIEVEDVPSSTWQRASTPPAWAVLESTPLPSGEPLRPWQDALADYVPWLRRQQAAAAR
jgi:dTDP-4-dehydrorhamnose reductase